MHVVQVVGVRCQGDAETTVESLLADLSSRGMWFDWFEIGGRWDGFFAVQHPDAGLENGNVLSFSTHPELVREELGKIRRQQNETYLSVRDAVLGNAVEQVDNARGHILGFPVVDDPAVAARLTKYNRDVAEGWKAILNAPSLNEARTADPTFTAAYEVNRLIDMCHETWNSDSGYVDLDNESTRVDYLLEDLGKPDISTHLVAVDFHF